MLENELKLIKRSKVDPSAFAEVYEHYFPRVYKYIRFRIRDPETADELTSQTFERVLTKIATFSPERGSFAVWLFTISRNTVFDYLRHKKRYRFAPIETLKDCHSAEPLPEELVLKKETHEELLSALATLKDRQREIVALKFGACLTNRSIAKLSGLRESNVGVILYRAIRQLRAQLSGKEEDK